MSQTAEEVLATIKYEGFVRALYNRTGDLSKDFTHAVLGLVTESYEYLNATDKVNAIEEFGDLLFYLEALKQVLHDLSPVDEEEVLRAYVLALEDIPDHANINNMHTEWLDLAKRWIGYGKAPTMPTSKLVAEASALVTITIPSGLLSEEDSTNLKEVATVNVRKLLKRYNGLQFSQDRAVNRDLAGEREVLEGGK